MRWWYRVKQVWWGATARPLSSAELAEVESVLSEAQLTLFRRMSVRDQAHALRVLRNLTSAGATEPALLQAALLHDAGKLCARLTLFDRSVAVLLAKLAPRAAQRWGRWEGGVPAERVRLGWRTGLVCRAAHPAWGADLAAGCGSDRVTVRLIREHQDRVKREDRLLARLQWADDLS
jgi:hypothetical protein